MRFRQRREGEEDGRPTSSRFLRITGPDLLLGHEIIPPRLLQVHNLSGERTARQLDGLSECISSHIATTARHGRAHEKEEMRTEGNIALSKIHTVAGKIED